jgi:membrane-bound lytic murein transglycosylase MltF
MRVSRAFVVALLVMMLAGCKQKEAKEQSTEVPASPAPQETANAAVTLPAPYGKHTEDLDQIIKRRNLRAIVILNPTGFFYDNGHPMGINYEALRELETYINQKEKTRALKIKVTFIPVRPDQMEAALVQGVGDFICYAVVVTPERQQRATFTVPVISDVKQVIVSGPKFGAAATLDDLGGKPLYVNPLTENYQIVQEMNRKRQATGKSLIQLKALDPNLTEEDILQMVSAGLVPATAANLTRANLWGQVLPNLTIHSDLLIASGQQGAIRSLKHCSTNSLLRARSGRRLGIRCCVAIC